MSVGLLIITHDEVGDAVLQAARDAFGQLPLPTATLSIRRDSDPDQLRTQAKAAAEGLNEGDGVLVITDMFGSTPGNVACSLLNRPDIRVVSGLNLPMLLKLFNYADQNLLELADKARCGGRDGVVEVPTREGSDA